MSLKNGIEKLSKMMDQMGLSEITVEQSFLFGVWKKEIHLSKAGRATVAMNPGVVFEAPKAASVAASAPVAAPVNAVNSPMVGVVYFAPEPGAKPFITEGSSVKAGDTLCLIEAMKTFNPVKSDRAGKVKSILVKDGQVVEFDTPLVVIE